MATVYWIRAPHHTDMFTEGYIGFSSRGTEKRFKQHKKDSKRDKNKHLPIYRAFDKYGDLLIVSTIVEGPDDYCLMIEQKLRPTEKIGWNINRGGEKASLGTKRSKESCEKQSKTLTGKKRPKEFGEIMSKVLKGKKKSPEHCAKMSAAQKGRKQPPELVAKIRAASEAGRKAYVEKLRSLPIWENPAANKDVWVLADKAHSIISETGVGAKLLGRMLGVHEYAIRVMCNKIKSGWNPNEDAAWLEFKTKYLQEATNAQST